jgi:hypothetical protein
MNLSNAIFLMTQSLDNAGGGAIYYYRISENAGLSIDPKKLESINNPDEERIIFRSVLRLVKRPSFFYNDNNLRMKFQTVPLILNESFLLEVPCEQKDIADRTSMLTICGSRISHFDKAFCEKLIILIKEYARLLERSISVSVESSMRQQLERRLEDSKKKIRLTILLFATTIFFIALIAYIYL